MSVQLFIVCPKCSANGFGFYYQKDSITWENENFEIECPQCKNILDVEITNITADAKIKQERRQNGKI